ncbi:ABC transporter substrate-binding protein [Thalassobaculum sp.]|uniref:ABC transporter substrate-binding protein n=1 Tax=Thalassobaculum sp. TaxID=2022740 RepID=UPI0032EAD7FB
MSKSTFTRRSFLQTSMLAGTAGGAALFGPWKHTRVHAAASDKPIRIGLTHDASGQFANSGQAERRGTEMAIAEFNEAGGVLGRRIDAIWMDTETNPQTGTRVAERMITRENVHFLVGAIQSGAANAISQVAQKYGCIYLNTNSSSPTEAGKNCHRVKFVWDGNGENFSKAAARNAIQTFGKKWFLIYNDYVWGQNTNEATKKVAINYGAEVVDEVPIPVGTRDWSSVLLRIQQAKPDVVAAAVGGDDFKVMRQQVRDMKLDGKPAWINNQQDWPDIYGLGADAAFGVFGTTWYHYLDLPGVSDFVKRYQERYPTTRINVPGNVTYNGYVAMRELLRVVAEVGSTDNIKIIKALEGRVMKAADRMQHHDAVIDADSHHVQQTIYLAQGNPKPKDDTDYFQILSSSDPDSIRADANKECKLESYADTPNYDQG